jgi:exosortase/archaeosortase family protein
VGETPAGTFVPILLTLLYAAAFHFVPPLVRAGLAMLALSSTFGLGVFGRAIHPASMGLMLLSLPVVPTLQFYLGYPMRAAVAWAACPALRVSGFEVERSGACLVTAGRMVMVDAPCSGVKMLWAGLLLAGVLALAFRMTPWRTVWTAAAAVGLVLVGNLLRTCALFVADATDYHLPSWGHSGVGVLAFAAAGGALVWLARRWRRVSPCG